jgi:hypothetical protein
VHPANVIKQDEFTHDVLVPLPSDRWLVYGHNVTRCGFGRSRSGTTCLLASEILEKRLAAGWKPTPSELQDGAVV